MTDWRPVALRKSLRFGLDLVLEEASNGWNWFVYDDAVGRVVARGSTATLTAAKLDSNSAGEMHKRRMGMTK